MTIKTITSFAFAGSLLASSLLAQTKAPEATKEQPAPAAPPAKPDAKAQPTAKKADRAPAAKAGGPHGFQDEPAVATAKRPQTVAPPGKGERIVLIGNGLA